MKEVTDSIKLVSLNIEGNKHLERITPFFEDESPDVILLQEVFEKDYETLVNNLGMHGFFIPLIRHFRKNGKLGVLHHWGLAALSKYPFLMSEAFFYARDPSQKLPVYNIDHGREDGCANRALMHVVIEVKDCLFSFGNTKFTWTHDGKPSEQQRRDFKALKYFLRDIPEIVLAGDFNAPRGGEIYGELSRLYRDNIPPDITSTLDSYLHRNPNLRYVVDGMFTSPGYVVRDVEVPSGLSDHCAVIGTISKRAV